MNRPVHFEIPAEDPGRAIQFYEKVFGWKFERWNGPMEYWTISTGESQPGINGGLMTRRDPAQPCVNTMGVADLDAATTVIEAAGGLCVVPKMPIPGVGGWPTSRTQKATSLERCRLTQQRSLARKPTPKFSQQVARERPRRCQLRGGVRGSSASACLRGRSDRGRQGACHRNR